MQIGPWGLKLERGIGPWGVPSQCPCVGMQPN